MSCAWTAVLVVLAFVLGQREGQGRLFRRREPDTEPTPALTAFERRVRGINA